MENAFRQLAEETCTAVLILMVKHWDCSFPTCCMYLNLVKTYYQPTQYLRMALALLVTATVLSSGVITIRNLFSLVAPKALYFVPKLPSTVENRTDWIVEGRTSCRL